MLRNGFALEPRCSRNVNRLQAGSVERLGEKTVHGDDFGFAFEIGENHRDVATEFPDELTTCAAGSGQRVGVGDNGDGIKAAFAFADGFEDGHTFGAHGETVSGVFDVAAAEDAAGSGSQGCAYAKV